MERILKSSPSEDNVLIILIKYWLLMHSSCVSMIELTNARQWKEEPVIDYIHRWRNLSLNCRDRLTETSALDMCIQGMHWGLRTGIARENCLPAAIMDATLKVLGRMKPTSLLGNTNLHIQHERKAAK
uniref:Retrotransposon gag domain-containing protein n=1 Tax=Salix viminalis TaxID=40686 RepID=A0A6N2KB02_SALVM